MKKYVFALVLFSTPALAQQPSQTVNMNMTVPEAQQALNALAQGPWKDVNPLMQKLISQLNPQLAPPPPAAPPPEAPKAEAPKLPSKMIPPQSSPPELPLPPLPRPKPPMPHPER